MPALVRDNPSPVEETHLWAQYVVDSFSPGEVQAVSTGNLVQLLVVGSESWGGNQAYMNQVLNGINSFTPITLIITMDSSFAATYARTWASQQGVTWQNAYPVLQGFGLNVFGAPLTLMDNTNSVLTCGLHARVSTVATLAAQLGKTVVQI